MLTRDDSAKARRGDDFGEGRDAAVRDGVRRERWIDDDVGAIDAVDEPADGDHGGRRRARDGRCSPRRCDRGRAMARTGERRATRARDGRRARTASIRAMRILF